MKEAASCLKQGYALSCFGLASRPLYFRSRAAYSGAEAQPTQKFSLELEVSLWTRHETK